VTKVFVIESFRKGLLLVFEEVDGSVLAVEEGTPRRRLLQGLPHEFAHPDRWVHGVAGPVDRAFVVEVGAGEIEEGMAEDRVRDGRVLVEDRPEERHGLGTGAAVEAQLEAADVLGQLRSHRSEMRRVVAHMGGVHLVPQVPGEDGAAAAPGARP
jgi:hypothetical protein